MLVALTVYFNNYWKDFKGFRSFDLDEKTLFDFLSLKL